jgi:dipeptidase E
MKMLLTSAGFENPKIGKEFLRLINKPTSEIKILFIPTASRTKNELLYIEKSKKEILGLGIKKENINIYNLDRKISNEELNKINAIYVCGGNTFYLLHKIKESGFGKKIKEMIMKGIVYCGASAGSILVSPDIGISGIEKNDIGIKDLTGLNLTDKIISPHYAKEDEEIVRKFEKDTGRKITRLTDTQALLIEGDEIKILE